MAQLFSVSIPTINAQLKNIFLDGKLNEEAVIRNFLITSSDDTPYNTKHYNLDAIISVSSRVNSNQVTRFKIWVTGILKEYIIKRFILDNKRLN